MSDETANGFRPASNIGDIVANRVGPEMAREGGGNLRFVRKHCCGRFHCTPENGLNIVG
jgi:hypothetical protein